MEDLHNCSREFLSEFIKLYESLPCLWQVNSEDYLERDKTEPAYDALVAKWKQIDPTCTRETVAKQIDKLRTVYFEESAIVSESKASGSPANGIYEPGFWYYDMLHFLRDQETPRVSKNSMDDDHELSSCEEEERLEWEDETDDSPGYSSSSSSLSSGVSTLHQSAATSRKRARNTSDDETTKVMNLLGRKLLSLEQQDGCSAFASYVGDSLRNVNPSQKTLAKALICKILAKAEDGTLTWDDDIGTKKQ